ncbi:MAG: bifunctional tetrahydrofolate synthase/dihydrofolate synthase [Rhodocyclaceae bacterium]|nr:bifunctional tetrahydrofolate synthase/dihydrofolate synthase [Rhodocyclaceae bacterium]
MTLSTLSDWLAYLEALHPRGAAGIELGLERVKRVQEALRQEPFCPVIVVGGTNGKGSTCAFLESILLAAGYRVGLYTSPHLLRYNERVRLAGRMVEDEPLCEAFARVEAARRKTATSLTYFEFGTLAAWEVFARHSLDAVIMEVGMGGRLDAVNAFEPDCSVITSIALDHTEYLGPTRDAIGAEKAGIARPHKPLICGDAEPPETIEHICRSLGADYWRLGQRFGYHDEGGQWRYWDDHGKRYAGLPYPSLRGAHQLANASCALAVLSQMSERLPVSSQEIRRGLVEASVPGRFQVLPGQPRVVLDVAHNPHAVQALAENLAALATPGRLFAVFGAMADKDLAGMIGIVAPRIDRWFVAAVPSPRAAPAEELASLVEACGGRASIATTPGKALQLALEEAGPDDTIVVFGSFLMVAAALERRPFAGRE